MMEYKKIPGKSPMLNPRKLAGRMRSAAVKGRREIGGRTYVLFGSGDKHEVEQAAKTRRKLGQSCRIFRSKYYGDYELWVSRVPNRR